MMDSPLPKPDAQRCFNQSASTYFMMLRIRFLPVPLRDRELSPKFEAEAKLREGMGASERGEKAKPQTQGLTYAELRADLLAYYAERQHKSLKAEKDGTPYLFPLTALDS